MRSSRGLGVLAVTALSAAVPASAQTVRDIAARGECSTAGVEGISRQLAEYQMCMRPDGFVEFAPHAGISLTSSRVHPFLQSTARRAVWAASERVPLRINSAFRTLAEQYVLYHSGACGLAATPGRSNHQTGRAIDVSNYGEARSALTAQGCTWLGSSDPVHFDCPGTDRRSDSVLAFQKLWNLNHPDDRIAEDGDYGPATESRLARSPAAGFRRDGCGCELACDGAVLVGADCERLDCGDIGGLCSTAASAPRCVDRACVDAPDAAPRAHDLCLPDGRLARCSASGDLGEPITCPEGMHCESAGDAADCVEDGVPLADAGIPLSIPPGTLTSTGGGCSTTGSPGVPLLPFLLALLLFRRR